MEPKFKKARKDTMKYVPKWFYETKIAFNSATLRLSNKCHKPLKNYGVGIEAPRPLTPYD